MHLFFKCRVDSKLKQSIAMKIAINRKNSIDKLSNFGINQLSKQHVTKATINGKIVWRINNVKF